jgi:hypothetical protein
MLVGLGWTVGFDAILVLVTLTTGISTVIIAFGHYEKIKNLLPGRVRRLYRLPQIKYHSSNCDLLLVAIFLS